MLYALAALILVPAAAAFTAVSVLTRRNEGRIPASAYMLSLLLPMVLLWTVAGVLSYRAANHCAPMCDGMAPPLAIIFGVLASLVSGMGGVIGCFIAIERMNRRT